MATTQKRCKACAKPLPLVGMNNRRFCDSLCRSIYHAKQDLMAQQTYTNNKPQRACEVCGSAYNHVTKWDRYCTETCRIIAKTPGPKNDARRRTLRMLPWQDKYRYRDTLAQERLDRAQARYARNKRRAEIVAARARPKK